jgi:hypothetical protein
MSMPSSLRLKEKPSFVQNEVKTPSSLKKKPSFEGESEEETERNIDRNKARTLSRMGETALGAPGDIASFFAGLFGKEQSIFPTSSQLKEKTEKASFGYLQPKNKNEERGDELASDIASMALPGAGKYNMMRNIGIPIVANLVKEGLNYVNAGEKSQGYAKIGTMVALDLISRRSGGVKSHLNSLYQKAEQALPEGLSFDASNLERSLNKIEKNLKMGGERPTTTKSLKKIDEIKKDIKNGKIEGKKLAAYRPAINEIIDDIGGFNFEMSRKLKPQAIRNLNEVKGEAIKSLEQYGKKFNPEYLKYSQDANEAYAAYSQSNRIANFIQNKLPYSPKSKAVQALFSIAPHATLGAVGYLSPAAATGAAVGLTGYQAVKILERVRRSPVLRKYYQNVLKEAASGNIPQTSKNMKALDEILLKEEE